MRPQPLSKLLESILLQTTLANEVLIIDGSTDNETELLLQDRPEFRIQSSELDSSSLHSSSSSSLRYFKVPAADRGLTKQRNYGIERVGKEMEVVAFLDDDTVLEKEYVENLLAAYKSLPDASGIGGVATNENRWKLKEDKNYDPNYFYVFKDYVVSESARNVLRNKLGLASQALPSIMPEYSHGKTFSYPLTGDNYPVDLLVGMSMSFRKKVVDAIKFSTYFEGYGLYEDADYSIRALEYGQNYLATSVRLKHHHDAAGRPNTYAYGKMVVRNGWYVWRVKHPHPSFKNKLKWYQITLLLAAIRFLNTFTTRERKESFTESMGRIIGMLSLLFSKPR
jgi:GT2 family glycosyltransferase